MTDRERKRGCIQRRDISLEGRRMGRKPYSPGMPYVYTYSVLQAMSSRGPEGRKREGRAARLTPCHPCLGVDIQERGTLDMEGHGRVSWHAQLATFQEGASSMGPQRMRLGSRAEPQLRTCCVSQNPVMPSLW